MSRKSKKSNQSDADDSVQPLNRGFAPLFSPEFKADSRWWYRYEPKKADRIMDLLADILDGDPFTGIGKPEPLKYIAPNTWSRRTFKKYNSLRLGMVWTIDKSVRELLFIPNLNKLDRLLKLSGKLVN